MIFPWNPHGLGFSVDIFGVMRTCPAETAATFFRRATCHVAMPRGAVPKRDGCDWGWRPSWNRHWNSDVWDLLRFDEIGKSSLWSAPRNPQHWLNMQLWGGTIFICYFLSISCLLNPPAADNSQPTPWDVTQTPLVSLSPPRIEVLAGSGDSRPSASQVATLSGIVRDSSGIVGDMAWVRSSLVAGMRY